MDCLWHIKAGSAGILPAERAPHAPFAPVGAHCRQDACAPSNAFLVGVLSSTETAPLSYGPIAITENGELAKPDFSAAPNDFE